MSKQLLNLTLSVVIDEIENILATYPKHPYYKAFSAAGFLHQDLIAYVLSHVPNKYVVIEETELLSKQIALSPYSTQQLLDIEPWIHLGIRDILYHYNKKNNCDDGGTKVA